MKVYLILEDVSLHKFVILGVFKDKEYAKECLDNLPKKSLSLYQIEEWEVTDVTGNRPFSQPP